MEPVCPLVTGLPKDMAEYMLLRISEIARAAGAPLAGEKCRRQNLFIIVTKQPEAYLRELQKRHGESVFGGAAPILIDEFITTPRPVRSWYDTVEMTPDGLPLLQMSFSGITDFLVTQQNGAIVVLLTKTASNDPSSTLTNSWSQASHLVLNVVWAMKRVYVVVDPTKFKGVKLGQLADYIAMAGLAQIKLDPKVAGDPTILTLFDRDPQAASPGLTDWDQAFLKGFYTSEQKSVVLHVIAIARDMVRTMAPWGLRITASEKVTGRDRGSSELRCSASVASSTGNEAFDPQLLCRNGLRCCGDGTYHGEIAQRRAVVA